MTGVERLQVQIAVVLIVLHVGDQYPSNQRLGDNGGQPGQSLLRHHRVLVVSTLPLLSSPLSSSSSSTYCSGSSFSSTLTLPLVVVVVTLLPPIIVKQPTNNNNCLSFRSQMISAMSSYSLLYACWCLLVA